MSIIKYLKNLNETLLEIKGLLSDEGISVLEKEYKEYRTFADARGMKMLSDAGLIDEYNEYMSACENILFSDISVYTVELPKPSSKLEAFKNKFNKFFK